MNTVPDPVAQAWQQVQANDLRGAVRTLDVALRRDPNDGAAWLLAAQAMLGLGNTELALEAARHAVRSTRGAGSAWYVLGRAQKSANDVDGAVESYRRAIAAEGSDPAFHTSLGVALRAQHDLDGAIAAYRRALELDPAHVEAQRNLANALLARGSAAEAEQLYRVVDPQISAEVERQIELARTHWEAKRSHEAMAALREALRLAPDMAPLHRQLGAVYKRLGRRGEAFDSLDRALDLDPTLVEAVEAARVDSLAVGLPDMVARYSAMARTVAPGPAVDAAERLALPAIQDSRATIAATRARFDSALDELLDGNALLEDPLRCYAPTFYLAYHGESDRALMEKTAAFYVRACPSLAWTAPGVTARRDPDRRLRIGFASAFLRQHSIGKTTRGLVKALSRESFEVVTIRLPPHVDDEVARAIDADSDRVVVLGTDLDAARRTIAELDLDVLFYQDIGMEARSYFLSFARLAPVQCLSFGHPNTTGVPAMDWFVSNDLFETAEAPQHYSERLFLLHGLPTLAYYERPQVPTARPDRAAFGVPADTRLYLCPQTLFKLHPDMDTIFAGILRRDPSGRIVLIRGDLPHYVRALQQRFARTCADVADRIVFVDAMSSERFLGFLGIADVILDTLHFNGMNSSLESFAAGTPVITLPGPLQRARHTSAMYAKMELRACIAQSVEDYVELALRAARDADFAAEMRREIAARRDVLYEDPRVLTEFERFFRAAARAAPMD